jgi:NADPH:quinone reductase
MRAAIVSRYGGPEVLQIVDVPPPVPGPRQLLVRTRAIGLNFADIFGRFGLYPATPKPPFIPGIEFSGEVADIGSDVTEFRAGDRVAGYSRQGSHAEYVAVNADRVVAVPDSMSYADAASLVVTSMTAYHGLVTLARLREGERLLVHAAAGGVGIATLQLGRHLGAEIVATAGSDEKVAVALAHGAHHAVNYSTTPFAPFVRERVGDAGVDVVMDAVGGRVFTPGWNLLAPMGRYILYGTGAVAGPGGFNYLKAAVVLARMRPVFPWRFITTNRSLMGFNLGTIHGKDGYLREAASAVLRLQREGVFRPVIGKTFPFDRIAEAHHYLQSRQSTGKVVVLLDEREAR